MARSVALDGANALISGPGLTPAGSTGDYGAAFLFERTTPPEGVVWSLVRTFQPPESEPGVPGGLYSGFGASVALHAADVLVGAPAALLTGGLGYGRVYVYSRSTGELLETLTAPTPTLGDRFGAAIAHHGDLIAVAAPGDECDLGQVHLFRRGGRGWTFEATLSAPGDATEGWIGFANALAIDRERVMVGTGGVRAEDAYGSMSAVFRRSGPVGSRGTAWTLETTIDGDPSNPTGSPVAIDPSGIVAAEPSIGLGQVRYVGLEHNPDLNFDGAVGAGDLAIVLGSWGDGAGSPADLNGDGVVDQTDLAVLLGAWS
ncbi:MAG: hypothetical protein JNL80_16395 [Phycisphaerae bacterium]|jgi:hypothetical protein|nr:hypothetical protein [Phycisphaerae bacterium]